jgi:hypothetical protein
MAEPPAKATSALAVKARKEPVRRARQSVGRRPAAENLPDSAKRPAGLEVPPRRLDRLGLAFAAPVRQRSIPWRARLGGERRLCSYRSSHKWSEPLPPLRVKFSNFPCAFLPAFAHNRFHAARAQSRRARSRRKARKEARSQTTWTTGPASGQPVEGIRCRPFFSSSIPKIQSSADRGPERVKSWARVAGKRNRGSRRWR